MLKILKKAHRAQSGMAAVEFAMVLPAMLALVFGSIEVTNALVCKGEVTNTASTAADLIAQETKVTDADLNNVYASLNALLYPYPTSGTQVRITSIIDDGQGGAKVAWSQAQNVTPYTTGQAMTVPTGLIQSGGSVIYAEVTYSYTSPFTYIIHSPISMANAFYSHPRRVPQIPYSPQ
jgi:Flp pilus assembly protein TadG